MTIAVHQVLASLGYGDAIGHEVLGIDRARTVAVSLMRLGAPARRHEGPIVNRG